MRKTFWLVLFFVAVVVCSGCATKIYTGPGTGRSAEQQIVISTSAQEVAGALDFSFLKGRKVKFEIFGLPLDRDLASEKTLIYSLLREKLAASGATLVDAVKDCDTYALIAVKTAGTDIIRRDFPPFYHHTGFRGVVHLRVVCYSRKDGAIENAQEKQSTTVYKERYIFYIFGPIRDLYIDVKDTEPSPVRKEAKPAEPQEKPEPEKAKEPEREPEEKPEE